MGLNDPQSTKVLAELGRAVGIDLAPDANGLVCLRVDTVDLTLESPEGAPFLYMQGIVRKVASDRARDLEAIMKANLFGHPLSNGWMALDPETDDLRLCVALPLHGLDADRLSAQIEAFALSLADLKQAHRPGTNAIDPEFLGNGYVRI